MDYGILISIAAFFVAMQLAVRTNIRSIAPAAIAVFIPYVISLVTKYIMLTGYHLPVWSNLFSVSSVVVVLLQFVAGLYIFKKIADADDLLPTILWSAGGFIVIIVALPFIAGRLFS